MTTETKPKNGILSDLELAGVEIRERAALPWEVDLRVTPEPQQGRRWPDLHPPIGDQEGAIRAANAVLDWQTSTLQRFTVGYDAGWLLLEVPSEDRDRWARRQGRCALLAVHLYADGDAGSTRCGLDAFAEYAIDYGVARTRTRQMNVWTGSELSRREDAASWEQDSEAALNALERLCVVCSETAR